MKYIIIGGGISGLYCAYSLHKNLGTNDILIVEKSYRLGGRINTKNIDNKTTLEMGAGRIASTHKNAFKLIKELGLGNKLTKGLGGRSYAEINTAVINKDYIYRIDKYIPLANTDFFSITDDLINKLSDPNFYNEAVNCNLYRLIEKYYGIDKAILMTNMFGYHDDFIEQNAVNGLFMFAENSSFGKNTLYHGLDGGLEQIIFSLKQYLENNSVKILLNHECINIYEKNNGYDCLLNNDEKYFTENIIFAIPKKNLMDIDYLNILKNELDTVVDKPLVRIYAVFPKMNNKIWFDNLDPVITTKSILRQIVLIDKKKGIIMIYGDGENARTWNYFNNKNILETELMFNLRKLFNEIDIPDLSNIYFSYYESATHVWKPTVDSNSVYKKMIQPISNKNLYIVGEAYSLTQQWSEGAIESVNDCIDMINNKNITYTFEYL